MLASQLRRQVEAYAQEGEERSMLAEMNKKLRKDAAKARKELVDSEAREKMLTQTVSRLNITMSQMLS